MASGMRSIVINTQERAVSTDINRLQSFKSQSMAEIFRYMMDVFSNEELTSGNITEPNSIETPLRGEILNGLLVQPQGGTLSLLVQDGAVWLMQPDGAADDSNYKLVLDPGVTNSNPLLIGANSSGSVRVDIIECQMNTTLSVVNDNRDIFNSVSGQFTAQSVVKEKKNTLSYRVRAGTPGGGLPSVVSGWMPLCVASVPNGASNVDTITFWDVRPLVSERAFGVSNTSVARPVINDVIINAMDIASVTGRVDGIWGSRRVGGNLLRGSPGTDAAVIDFTDSSNQAASFGSFPSGAPVHFYLCFPNNLPRWVRYTDAPLARTPRGCRGIPIVSAVICTANNLATSNIVLPNVFFGTSFNVTPANAMLVVPAMSQLPNLPFPAKPSFVVHGKHYTSGTISDTTPITYQPAWSGGQVTVALVAGVDFPHNARTIDVSASLNGTFNHASMFIEYGLSATGVETYTAANKGIQGRFHLPPVYPGVSQNNLNLRIVSDATPSGNPIISITGWDFG